MSFSLIRAISSSDTMPFSIALPAIFCGSIPAPLSLTSITTCPASWKACKRNCPKGGLPAALRCAGVSRPWSIELRTRCVRGSPSASIIVLSSSTSSPKISRFICLPSCPDKSRTMRRNLLKTISIVCIRVDIIARCN